MEHPRFHYDLEHCSIRRALDVLGEKWTLLVLREAFYGLCRFDDFARALGCGRGVLSARLRTLTDITAPLLRSAVIATWCFVFVAVIRELSAAVILFTSETKVLSVLIFDLKESGDVGAIAVLSLAMVGITTIVIAIANRLGGGRESGRLHARAAG